MKSSERVKLKLILNVRKVGIRRTKSQESALKAIYFQEKWSSFSYSDSTIRLLPFIRARNRGHPGIHLLDLTNLEYVHGRGNIPIKRAGGETRWQIIEYVKFLIREKRDTCNP